MMNRALVVLALAAAVTGCSPPPATDLCKGRVEGDLVITEVMVDPAGVDTGGEWIEIFNALGTPLDLKGLTLYVHDTDGSAAKTHVIKAGTAPARGYFVMGDVRSGPNPAWINYSYADGLGSMGNARGVVGVRCGTTTLAELTYTTPAKPQRSRMLDGVSEPTSALAAVEANFCDTPAAQIYSANNSGTPGAANPRCVPEATAGTCLDNGAMRATTPPQPGDLVITEVMASPSATSDTTGEWLEVLVRASVDLNGVSINTTTSSVRITTTNCLRAEPGDYVLLARSGDSFVNGGLPTPHYVYGSITFADTTNQRISLSLGDAGIDEIALNPSASGKAWQLDPLKLDPGSNDDPGNLCHAPNRWNADGGGDYGSPGVANPACPVDAGQADPNVCVDPGTGAQRPVRHPIEGDLVITEWHSFPAAVSAANGEWIEVLAKNDLDLNGLTLQVGTSKTPLSSMNCLPVTANSFLVFGKNADPALNGGLPPLTASFTAALTGTSTMTLLGSDGGVYDSVTATGETSGASVQIVPGFENPTDNDLPGNRCRSPHKWNPDGGGDYGSPGRANPACAGGSDAGVTDPNLCLDPTTMAMRPIVRPANGDLVITEWMSDPGAISDAVGEYFEVLAKGAADLNGLTLKVGTTSTKLASNTCLPVAANSYLVFGKTNDPLVNGNLPALTATFSGSLTASSLISVVGADGGLYDAVTANGETAGASVQIKPGAESPTDNDVLTPVPNRCTTPVGTLYGPLGADGGATGNRGTPGLPGVACP